MSKHFQFESRMSLTGSNSDVRVLVKPSEEGKVLAALYAAITGGAPISVGEADNPGNCRREPNGYNRSKGKDSKMEYVWIRSQTIGSMRSEDRKCKALEGKFNIAAF